MSYWSLTAFVGRLVPPVFQGLEHDLLTKGEVMVKWGTRRIPKPPMGKKPRGTGVYLTSEQLTVNERTLTLRKVFVMIKLPLG